MIACCVALGGTAGCWSGPLNPETYYGIWEREYGSTVEVLQLNADRTYQQTVRLLEHGDSAVRATGKWKDSTGKESGIVIVLQEPLAVNHHTEPIVRASYRRHLHGERVLGLLALRPGTDLAVLRACDQQ